MERAAIIDSANRPGRSNVLADYLQASHCDRFDVIVSANTGSIECGALMAASMAKPLAYVRQKPKQHGLLKQVEGVIQKGARVLLIAREPIRPESVAGSIRAIEELEGHVVHCLLVGDVDEHIRSLLQQRGISFDTAPAPNREAGDLAEHTPRARASTGQDPRHKASPTQLKQNSMRVADALLTVRAVTINRWKPYRYASGILSPIYTDCRLLMSNPKEWMAVIDAFIDLIGAETDLQAVDVIGGTATSGIPHASLIAADLGLPTGYVTFEESPDGLVVGTIQPNQRVVMIEDHISTGTSVLTAAAVLRQHEAVVDACFAIFTYGSPIARASFLAQNIHLHTLCNLDILLEVAQERGYIKPDEADALNEWSRDAQAWTRREEERLSRLDGTSAR